jgi:uncharacterized membrane protein (DUF485 family)
MKKMNKKLIKILTILMIVLMTVCCGTVAFAAENFHVDPITPDNNTPFGIVITVVQYGCYVAAFIWIMIVGVKYMTSAPDGKAEMKKQALAALIGGMILFGAGTIVKWVSQVTPQ